MQAVLSRARERVQRRKLLVLRRYIPTLLLATELVGWDHLLLGPLMTGCPPSLRACQIGTRRVVYVCRVLAFACFVSKRARMVSGELECGLVPQAFQMYTMVPFETRTTISRSIKRLEAIFPMSFVLQRALFESLQRVLLLALAAASCACGRRPRGAALAVCLRCVMRILGRELLYSL